MTSDFNPTSVDWNNPDVKYVMKHVKMAMTNRDDENEVLKKTIGELTAANSELTAANSEILDHVKELQSKYDKLAEAYRLLEGGSGTVPDVDKHKEKDPSKRRSYNVRVQRLPEDQCPGQENGAGAGGRNTQDGHRR